MGNLPHLKKKPPQEIMSEVKVKRETLVTLLCESKRYAVIWKIFKNVNICNLVEHMKKNVACTVMIAFFG